MRLRQYHVAVFTGNRATDLVTVFATIALSKGEAFHQAWSLIRDHWTTDPAKLEYHAVIVPVTRGPRRQAGKRDGQA